MDLKKLISNGESETLEFKESFQLRDEIGETVSAFSNLKGGIILIGVSDKTEFYNPGGLSEDITPKNIAEK